MAEVKVGDEVTVFCNLATVLGIDGVRATVRFEGYECSDTVPLKSCRPLSATARAKHARFKAQDALLKAAVEHCDERDKAYAAMLRGVLADFDSVDRTRAAVLYAADAYARAVAGKEKK